MRIRSSHLTLRFYESEGWTKEILEMFLIKGEIESTRFKGDQDPYYRLNHQTGAQFNADKLATFASEILDYKGDALILRDERIAYIKDNNW